MIKRVSLVWKHPNLSDDLFQSLWLGEHAELATKLVGLREYVIDFIADAPPGLPSGIATLRFDSMEALEAAFADEQLRMRLHATRDEFANRVEVFIVDETVVFRSKGESCEQD
jgi:uncharacterized protein (TIGR02118 family)